MWRIVLVVQLALHGCFSLRVVEQPSVTSTLCGNGVLDAGEACDATAFAGSQACVLRAIGAGGSVTCTRGCQIDVSTCVLAGDPALQLWLSGRADDPTPVTDHSGNAIAFPLIVDGAPASSPSIVALSSVVAVASDPPSSTRAFELTLGTGHAVLEAASVVARSPMTYELWIAPTAATPTDHEMVVFEHQTACVLALVPSAASNAFRVRATCGGASIESSQLLPAGRYTFVSLELAQAVVSLGVDNNIETVAGGPVLSGAGHFAFANSLNPSDGASKQFVGRIDDLRLFAGVRAAQELCVDAGGASCN